MFCLAKLINSRKWYIFRNPLLVFFVFWRPYFYLFSPSICLVYSPACENFSAQGDLSYCLFLFVLQSWLNHTKLLLLTLFCAQNFFSYTVAIFIPVLLLFSKCFFWPGRRCEFLDCIVLQLQWLLGEFLCSGSASLLCTKSQRLISLAS